MNFHPFKKKKKIKTTSSDYVGIKAYNPGWILYHMHNIITFVFPFDVKKINVKNCVAPRTVSTVPGGEVRPVLASSLFTHSFIQSVRQSFSENLRAVSQGQDPDQALGSHAGGRSGHSS